MLQLYFIDYTFLTNDLEETVTHIHINDCLWQRMCSVWVLGEKYPGVEHSYVSLTMALHEL